MRSPCSGTMAEPERLPAIVRAALGEALVGLLRRPWSTGSALLVGAAGGLALRSGDAAFRRLAAAHHFGAATGGWLIAGTLGALLGAAALVTAIAGAAGPPEPEVATGERVTRSLQRGVAVLSLWATERVVEGTLLLAAGAVALRLASRMHDPTPRMLAAAVVAAGAPPLLCALIAVPAFRIAVAETALGEESWRALARGFALALSHLPAAIGVGLAALAVTAPLWLLAIALGRVHAGPLAAAPIAALQGALLLASAAWAYGALAALARSLSDEGASGRAA